MRAEKPSKVEVLSIYPNLHLTLQPSQFKVVDVHGKWERIRTREHKRVDFTKFRVMIDAEDEDRVRELPGYGKDFLMTEDLHKHMKEDKAAFKAFMKRLRTRYVMWKANEYNEKEWDGFVDKLLGDEAMLKAPVETV